MGLIDHIEFAVRDAEISRLFYEQALAPLGFELVITVGPERTRMGGPGMAWVRTATLVSGCMTKSCREKEPILHSQQKTVLSSTLFIKRHWSQEDATMARRVSASTTTQITMLRTCLTPMVLMLKWYARSLFD